MTIADGEDIIASDFIYETNLSATPLDDKGKVAKLESNAHISPALLGVGPGSITYNEAGQVATYVATGTPNVTYTFTYLGDYLATVSDGSNTWTFTWTEDRITSIAQS